MLEIKNLVKSYDGKKEVLKGVDLTVEKGDIFGFIGHNGAGKTTLIKCVVGLLPYEKGTITIGGTNVKEKPIEIKKKIAYVPDNPDVYESLTGLEYLNFIADCFEINLDIRKERIEKYALEFEMKEHLNSLIRSYSHGMKQKIILIGSFIHEPELLVLDEPFVGLDPLASFVLKKLMHEFVNRGNSIFFSTHVLDTAEKICNRVALIKDGTIIKAGTMEEVRKDESLEQVFIELIEERKEND